MGLTSVTTSLARKSPLPYLRYIFFFELVSISSPGYFLEAYKLHGRKKIEAARYLLCASSYGTQRRHGKVYGFVFNYLPVETDNQSTTPPRQINLGYHIFVILFAACRAWLVFHTLDYFAAVGILSGVSFTFLSLLQDFSIFACTYVL